MRGGIAIVCCVVVGGCASPSKPTCPPGNGAVEPTSAHRTGLVIATRYCDVEYTAGSREDAKVLASIAERAAQAVERELTFAHTPFAGIACRIHQHGVPDEIAGDGHSSSQRFDVSGEYSADMHFLALSMHSPTATTSAGMPMDGDYLAKIVFAEFASIALDRGMKQKKQGFRLADAPSWFRAGYPEYLAMTLSSSRYRTLVLPKYIAAVRAEPSRIKFGVELEVKARWNDGAVLLAFLHDTYGKRKVQACIQSDKPSFDEAFRATFGISLAAMEPAFGAWLAKP